jgi:hypothetical protein
MPWSSHSTYICIHIYTQCIDDIVFCRLTWYPYHNSCMIRCCMSYEVAENCILRSNTNRAYRYESWKQTLLLPCTTPIDCELTVPGSKVPTAKTGVCISWCRRELGRAHRWRRANTMNSISNCALLISTRYNYVHRSDWRGSEGIVDWTLIAWLVHDEHPWTSRTVST